MTDKERQQNVLRFVYALRSCSGNLSELQTVETFKHYDKEQLKEAICDLVQLMPWLMRKWTGSDNLEGKLYLNENGEFELVKCLHGCPSGSDIEVYVCGTWLKTKIEPVGKTFYAAGLKGFSLVGVLARIPESEAKQ